MIVAMILFNITPKITLFRLTIKTCTNSVNFINLTIRTVNKIHTNLPISQENQCFEGVTP